jgi:hypothetical protein
MDLCQIWETFEPDISREDASKFMLEPQVAREFGDLLQGRDEHKMTDQDYRYEVG